MKALIKWMSEKILADKCIAEYDLCDTDKELMFCIDNLDTEHEEYYIKEIHEISDMRHDKRERVRFLNEVESEISNLEKQLSANTSNEIELVLSR